MKIQPATVLNPKDMTWQVVEGKPHFPLTRESGIVDVNGVCKALDAYGYDGFVVFETRKEYTESKNVFEEAMTSLK